MGKLKLCWSKLALKTFLNQCLWYENNASHQYAKTFSNNIQKAISQVISMPSTGRLEKKSAKKTYRSILSHPKSRIHYWYDDKELHIIGIIFSQKTH